MLELLEVLLGNLTDSVDDHLVLVLDLLSQVSNDLLYLCDALLKLSGDMLHLVGLVLCRFDSQDLLFALIVRRDVADLQLHSILLS